MANVACLRGGRYCPMTDLRRRHPQWRIVYAPLRGLTEVMDLARRVVLLDRTLTAHQIRANLAHAICHIDLEHRDIEGPGRTQQEDAAEQLAAARCITYLDLRQAIWDHGEDWPVVAETLAVDERLLRRRLREIGRVGLLEAYRGACTRPMDGTRAKGPEGPICTIRPREQVARPLVVSWPRTLTLVPV